VFEKGLALSIASVSSEGYYLYLLDAVLEGLNPS
jgi:hypothetical protein